MSDGAEDAGGASPGIARRPVLRLRGDARTRVVDALAREEPLQIRLNGEPVAVVMRTPGNDLELAAGFAITERLVPGPEALRGLRPTRRPDGDVEPNDVDVVAAPGDREALERARRAIFASTSCGLCGKTTIAAVHLHAEPFPDAVDLDSRWLRTLPAVLHARQRMFLETGGLHAAAFFLNGGTEPVLLREDVGRHNACDKVVGATRTPLDAWPPPGASGRAPPLPPLAPQDLRGGVLLVSGRASFEIVQKAWVAGIGAIAAVSAPSSLAVDLAREARMTLVGFLAADRVNVYCGSVDGHAP